MRILDKCISNLKKIVKNNQILILESTVYPGATMELFQKLNKKNNFTLGKNFFLIFSPERENPGDHLFTYKVTPKVLGGSTKNCAVLGREIYKFIARKTHTTKTIEIAEMSKLLENSYRSVNIGLVNEIKIISQKMGINIWDVIDAAKTKNFGVRPFNPGPGTGGHCIPIDPLYLVWASKKKNFIPKLISASSKLNINMPKVLISDKLSKKAEEIFRKNGKVYKIKTAFINRLKYITYLFYYTSQIKVWIGLYPFIITNLLFNRFYVLQNLNNNLKFQRPHQGKLLYEKFKRCEYPEFKKIIKIFLKKN
jgi:UDP-N-acetyl-D-glucosamine dehydrogenase